MRVVYIAGPYRAASQWSVDQNIAAARLVGSRVARLGAMPMIPHSNTSHFDGLMPDSFWLEGTLELMRRCDAVMLCPDWDRSSGTLAEVKEAKTLDIPVFAELSDLQRWLKSQ